MSFYKLLTKQSSSRWLIAVSTVLLFGCNPVTKTETTTTTKNETSKTTGGVTTTTSTETTTETESNATSSNTTEQSTDEVSTEIAGRKTDNKELAAKVLMRPDFIGRVKMAYMAAKEIPGLCQKLFCYCGCDYTDEHTSLLDCYTCDHSVDCDYCKGEVMMAFKMTRKGATVAEIQKAIDLNWGPHYPFYEQPSDAIKKYWKTRIWAPGKGPTAFEHQNDSKPIMDPFTGNLSSDSKPMGTKADCCGKKHGDKKNQPKKQE